MEWLWPIPAAVAALTLGAVGIARFLLWDQVLMARLQIYMSARRTREALPLAERLLDMLSRRRGSLHPDTATARYTLGHLCFEHGHRARGAELVREAAAALASHAATGDAGFAASLLNLASAQRTIGDLEGALESALAGAGLLARRHGALDPRVAGARGNTGVILNELGRPGEAATILEDVLQMCVRIHGRGSAEEGVALVNLAEARIRLGDFPAARSALDRAVGILGSVRAAPTAAGDEIGHAWAAYALLHETREEWEAAEDMRIRALAAFERALGTVHAEVAGQQEKLAAALDRLDRPTEAALARRRAVRIRAELLSGTDAPLSPPAREAAARG
ncbi:MAG: tetratricopeptide repeat protein [Bryobacteraceae bacterium]